MNKYLTVGDLRNANAVLRYAIEQKVVHVETNGPTEQSGLE